MVKLHQLLRQKPFAAGHAPILLSLLTSWHASRALCELAAAASVHNALRYIQVAVGMLAFVCSRLTCSHSMIGARFASGKGPAGVQSCEHGCQLCADNDTLSCANSGTKVHRCYTTRTYCQPRSIDNIFCFQHSSVYPGNQHVWDWAGSQCLLLLSAATTLLPAPAAAVSGLEASSGMLCYFATDLRPGMSLYLSTCTPA